jgi:hypothetical protein
MAETDDGSIQVSAGGGRRKSLKTEVTGRWRPATPAPCRFSDLGGGEEMKKQQIVNVVLRNKWALAVVSLGAVVASGGAGIKWN